MASPHCVWSQLVEAISIPLLLKVTHQRVIVKSDAAKPDYGRSGGRRELVVLNALAALLGAGAAVTVAHWYLHRVDALGRRRTFPTVWVVLLMLLSTGAAAPGISRARLENRLSSVASTLSDRGVRVRCQAFGEAFVDAGAEAGYVKYRPDGTPVDWTLLKRDQCTQLSRYLKSAKRAPGREQVIAVHVLTHEAMHLASVIDESRAECAAVQRDA